MCEIAAAVRSNIAAPAIARAFVAMWERRNSPTATTPVRT
jgi:hypothetical protein